MFMIIERKKEKLPGSSNELLGKLVHNLERDSTKTTERVLVFVIFLSSLLNTAPSFTKSGSWVFLTTRLSMGVKK